MKIKSLISILALAVNFAFAQHPLLEQKSTQIALVEEARQLIDAGLFQKAQWLLEDHLRTLPQSKHRVDALHLLVQSFVEQQKYEDAYQTSEEMFREKVSGSQFLTTLFYQGLSAYHTARFKSAVKSFGELIKADEKNIFKVYDFTVGKGTVYYWKAASEYELDNLRNAESDIKNAFELLNPPAIVPMQSGWRAGRKIGKDDVLFLWARVYEKRSEVNQAIERLEKLTTDNPTSELITDTRIRLAALYIRIGRYGSAVGHLNAVKSFTAKQKNEWLFYFAEAEYYIGSYKNSQKRYAELLRLYPFGIFARQAKYGLAWSYLKEGDYTNALKEFREISLGNDLLAQNALYQIGVISILNDSPASAIEAFEKLVEKFPYDEHSDNAYYQMGMIRYRQKQYPEARRNFQIAARLFPQSEVSSESYRMLGEASLAVGDLAYAQYAFSQVQKLPAHDTLRSAALIQEGITLYHLGRFNSSDEKFTEFVKKFNKHKLITDAYFWKGEALYQASKFDDSEQAYSNALTLMRKDHPKRIDAMYGLSWAYFEQKKFRQAINAFDKFIAENQNGEKNIEANLRKADCYFFLREYDKATQLYTLLSEEKKDSRLAEYAAFQLGLSYIQRGDVTRGVEHMRRFLQKFPSSIYAEVAQFNIAWAYFSIEQFARAIDEFTLFEERYTQSQLMPRVLLNKGDSYYNIGEYDNARSYYKRVIEEYPTSLLKPDAINGLQFTYQVQGRSADAVAAINAIMSRQTDSGGTDELLLRKGDILFGQENFGQAAVEYLRILDMQSSPLVKSKALFQLGRAYEFENNYQKSIEYFNRVHSEFPESEHAAASILSVGYIYIKQKQWREVLLQLRKIEERYPKSPLVFEAQYNIGVAQLNLKDSENARTQFNKVIQNAPVDEIFAHRSRLQIARMLQSKKQYNEAIDTLNVIVSILNDDIAAEALLLMGENYLALKKSSDALNSFNQVIEAFPHYPILVERARLGSGECYERLKDRSQAREAYTQIINNPIDPAIKKDAEERLRRLKR